MNLPVKGVILKTYQSGEADLIITLLTRESGLIKLFARAARKSKKRFAGVLEPYASVLIAYRAKPSGLHDLTEASLIDGRGSIRERLVSIAEAAHACELARLLSRESDPQPELFDLLTRFLDRVNREEAGLARTLMMELYFLAAAGYSPNLEGCARCAAAPDWTRTFYFSAREGSLKCAEHRELDDEPLTAGLQSLLSGKLDAGVPAQELARFDKILEAFLDHVLGERIKPARSWEKCVMSSENLPPAVLSVGELLLDFFPHPLGVDFDEVKSFSPQLGGGSANTAVGLARLGVRSIFFGTIGDDPFGDRLLKMAAKEGVDISLMARTARERTTCIFISIDKKGERKFLAVPKRGADLFISRDLLFKGWPKEARILHFGSSSLIHAACREAMEEIIKRARKNNAIVSFDFNLRPGLWNNFQVDRGLIKRFSKMSDLVKASEEEAAYIYNTKSIAASARLALQEDPKMFAVSRGKEGCSVFWGEQKLHLKAEKVKVVDTTGAGDAFCAGYLASFIQGNVSLSALAQLDRAIVEKAFRIANHLGAKVCTKVGALAAFSRAM